MSDSVQPHRWQPTRLLRPWDSPGKNTRVGCHFLLQCMKMKMKSESEIAQSCPTLSDPMDCSLPGSSVHGIFQARVLEWVAIAFSTMPTTEHLLSKKLSYIHMASGNYIHRMNRIKYAVYIYISVFQEILKWDSSTVYFCKILH